MQSFPTLKSRNQESLVRVHPAVERTEVSGERKKRKIALPIANGIRFVKQNEIAFCIAENNYCNLNLRDGTKILVSKTLKWVAERLPGSRFIRTHASYLINAELVEIFKTECIHLEGGQKIPVARSRQVKVREILMERAL